MAFQFYIVNKSLDINEVGSFQHAALCPTVVFLEESTGAEFVHISEIA
jgi:hypothetical protein